MERKRIYIVLLLFIFASQVMAQRSGNTNTRTDQLANLKQEEPKGPDTSIYNYSYRSSLDILEVYDDTLLHRIDIYNPTQQAGNEHLSLGNLASASTPIRYKEQSRLGLNYGYNQYDLYNFSLDSIQIFKLNRPLNHLYFSPFAGQQNFLVKALFAREFSDDISLFVNYRRFNQTGLYDNQPIQTTNLSSTIFVDKEKYKGIFSLLVNTNNEVNNGGIRDTSYYENPIYNRRTNIPVNLEGAENRKEEYIFSFLNEYALTRSNGFNAKLHYTLDWERGAIRSSDTEVDREIDSIYYREFRVDTRGVRNAFNYWALNNKLGMKLKVSDLVNFDTGVRYKFHSVDYFGAEDTYNELLLYGDLKTTYKGLGLEADAELGLADIAGDLDLRGKLSYEQEAFSLSGGIHFYRNTPNLKSQQLFVNENLLWKNDFDKILGTALQAEIAIPKANLSVGFKQIIENNTLYWDSTFMPRQLEDILTITQVELSHKLKLGPLNLDHRGLLQGVSSDSLALPELYLNQTLYFQFKLFEKRLESQIGAEGIYFSKYQSKSYMPLTGTFGNTRGEENQISNYPVLNCYINFKIKQFNFFVRFENINSLWESFPYYHALSYPQYDNNFRMGLRWLLND